MFNHEVIFLMERMDNAFLLLDKTEIMLPDIDQSGNDDLNE
jgi:hypothetical protein